ncbi:MAG: hypothetical protein MJ158_01225 [Alphaproteobacteria bacterium]|nr:hypothetical protein [Alphaproteobacteria bacterium]
MREDDKMWCIGLMSLILVFVLSSFIQVCHRIQNKTLSDIHAEREIVRRDYSKADELYTQYSSAEYLRTAIINRNPKAEHVNFEKKINIKDIPIIE